jgi:antitoxin component of MazEF toxin-antitoxin module
LNGVGIPPKRLKYYNAITISMTEFDATVRKVGDSMGILIPANVVKRLHAHPGTKLHVVIPQKIDWSGFRGELHSAKSTDELIRGARTERD